MREIPTKAVKTALGRWGFRKSAKGDASGHEPWESADGTKRVRPCLRRKMVNLAEVFALARQLESLGICGRREFIAEVKELV